MRALVHIAVAYVTLVVGGAVWPALPFRVVAPDVTAVFAVYLGITARQEISGAAATAVVIGYLADLLGGTPRGLMALVAGLTCVVGRLLTARLLVRGRLFVSVFCAVTAFAAALFTLGLRISFGVSIGGVWGEILVAVASALLTGLVAAPLFRICRAIDARFARTEREREAVREGYLN